jgi:hypothetical protein
MLSAGLTAEQNPFKKLLGGDKTSYQTFKDPAGRFEIEYPTKDWRLLPSGGSSLAVFARNDGPALFIDHIKLVDRLTAGEIDAMPEMELGRLKDQQPKGKDFKSECRYQGRPRSADPYRESERGRNPSCSTRFLSARIFSDSTGSSRKSCYRSTRRSSFT